VDLAINIITNEHAAIKVLKPGKTSSSSDIDMIFKEAENLKGLNHPNIVKILNCYALSDMRVVIVMEYLEGGELLGLLKKEKNMRLE
jgi:serine/threonine protein kinase